MNYEDISQKEKTTLLDRAVLTRSPEDVSTLYRQLGQVANSARALGLACRFRGLDHVRALVEGGARFMTDSHFYNEEDQYIQCYYYWLAPLEMSGTLRQSYLLDRTDACFKNKITAKGGVSYNVLPIEQRVEIVKYLYQCREKVCLDGGELFYYAIISGSRRIAKTLKEFGVKFSEQRITRITEKGNSYEWQELCSMLCCANDEEFYEIVNRITEEIEGKTLHYTESLSWGNCNHKQGRLYKPEFFQFFMEHFNQKKMNKKRLMEGAIDQNSVACLEICAENGWLQMPQKRDKMIQYASKSGKTECCAWLLDFKNRTADFAAEREKAQKKLMRELNANPDSVTELRKVWGFEKREDGTIVITRYKGKHTEVNVPEKIGNSIVAEIGSGAFSLRAKRLRAEQADLRRSITRITLPETIQVIGENAFEGCRALAQINIPDSVTMVGARAFYGCSSLISVRLPEGIREIGILTFSSCQSLQSVVIPKTVEMIGKSAFYCCSALETAVIPEGVVEIGPLAFEGCTSLKCVELPQSIQKIKNYTRKGQAPKTIFGKNTDVNVMVTPKSYSEKYCKRNNISICYKILN